MEVTAAIAARRTIRAFKPDPVPLSVVREILDCARRAPSGGNLQPWHVHVLTGEAKRLLSEALIAKYDANPEGEPGQHQPYPDDLPDPYRTRRRVIGVQLYERLGIGRADREGKIRHFGRNLDFFGAPVGLIFSIFRGSEPLQFVDLGIFIETVMLLATERGLSTCPQGIFSLFHRSIEAMLGLPENRLVVCGMALGHADESAPANALRAPRAEVDDFTVFLETL